ncbi:hypothetical protein Tco_1321613, partial [Tanacetum coccineum]
MQSPPQSLPKISSQHKGDHIKKNKGKKAMSSEEAEKESTNSGSNDDDETHKIEEEAKDEAAKHEGEVRKAKLVDLL